MATLAIKGHPTRGREVIQLLEMLGGTIKGEIMGNDQFHGYYINSNGNIDYKHYSYFDDAIPFTLEEFLEKFPYKVGDKVSSKYLKNCIIEKAEWESCCNSVLYKLQGNGWYRKEELQFYNEKNMEERKYADLRLDVDQDDKLATEVTINGDKITPPENYLIGKITKVDHGMLVEFVKKQSQYPKTYRECCEVLNITFNGNIVYAGYWVYGGEYLEKHLDVLRKFQQLLICRDAYCKIAGEEMGLEKPWKPDWKDSNFKYCLKKMGDNIEKSSEMTISCILAFPTAEMRDTFFENFKDLINETKELL